MARRGRRAGLRPRPCHLALGLAGWVWTKSFGVLLLGPADHVFHVAVGGLVLAAGLAAPRPQAEPDAAPPTG